MTYTFSQATIGSYVSGKNYNCMEVSGEIIEIYPSIGFLVRKDFYTYLIIDNFQAGEKQFNHHLESILPEYVNLPLSKNTTLFWLNGVGVAKSALFGKEIREKRLIDPMSREALLLPFKMNPIISAFGSMHRYKGEILDFYLKFGTVPGESELGHEGPLPLKSMSENESKRQLDIWHLERAKLQRVGIDIQGSYKYYFSEKTLVVKLHGEEINNIRLNDLSVQNTPYSSPAPKFVLKGAPEEFTGLDLAENKMEALSLEKLREGIEEAYWYMRRLRQQEGYHMNESYLMSMAWTDAAWDEIQARREEEL
jgi:hypothetical protein